MCEQFDYSAFVTHFDTLHGLDQLPGLAAQNMMADGYGFGAEGDWKVAAMDVIMKSMAEGMTGGTHFLFFSLWKCNIFRWIAVYYITYNSLLKWRY